MDKKLFVEQFRFNHKTDYLPYYRKYTVSYNEDTKVSDLIEEINSQEPFNYNGIEKYGLKINNLFVNINDCVADLAAQTSDTFIIEPASTYRVFNDLAIKNEDFSQKLSMLDEYLTDEQKENYENSLQNIYYASNSLTINKEYIGDHVLLAANEIIENNPEQKDNIIKLITNESNGIWYHTSLQNRIFNFDNSIEEKIANLLQIVTKEESSQSYDVKLEDETPTQEFNDFNIALYSKDDYKNAKSFIENSKATYIDITSKNNDLALRASDINKTFSHKLAGQILLEAKDNNADFIVVNDKKAFELFDKEQCKIEKAVGREINMPIVNLEQFNMLLKGEKNKETLGFNKHKVSVTFL